MPKSETKDKTTVTEDGKTRTKPKGSKDAMMDHPDFEYDPTTGTYKRKQPSEVDVF
jgi:hypothetical protein